MQDDPSLPPIGGLGGGGAAGNGMGGAHGTEAMGSTVLHRLSKVELANVVRDVLGADAAKALPDIEDTRVQSLDTNADALTVSPSSVDSMFETAKVIAEKLPITALGTCAQPTNERACAQERVDRLALRLLRRPATADEVASFMGLWDSVRSRQDATAATRAVVQRLLLAPEFLYHVEVGDPATGKLDGYEMASRLSFLAWESAPDEALYEAAKTGALTTKEGVEAALTRLLADPKGTRTMSRFFELWSDVDKLDTLTKDPAAYPGFDVLRAPMHDELGRFVAGLLERDGTVADLLTSRETTVDPTLAKFYGVDGPASGTGKVTLPAQRAGGFLTQGAFLAIHGKAQRSAPILRGIFVRERLLCDPVPPPPPGVSASIPPGTITDRTDRDYFASLTAAPICQNCHGLINPIGFAFEGFDGMGRARTMDNGLVVDTAADITGTSGADGKVANANELAARLASSAKVHDCLTRFWFRSRFRRMETGADETIIARASTAFQKGGGRLRALATALASEDAIFFAHFRTPEKP